MALFGISPAEHQRALDEIEALHQQLEETAEPTEWLQAVMTKRIIVHLRNDQSIDGSLVSRMDDGIVLRAAKLLDGSAGGTAMAGEVFIPREQVAFAQLDG